MTRQNFHLLDYGLVGRYTYGLVSPLEAPSCSVPDVKGVDHVATNDEQTAITTSALAVEEMADAFLELTALGGDGTALGIPLQLRVFYEVSQGENAVWVLAIGLKERNRLFIEGEEFEP